MSVELKVDEVTRYTVTLKWSYTEDDPGNAGEVPTGYALSRSLTTPGANMEMLALLPGRKYIDHDLNPATEYAYRVDTRGLTVAESDQFRLTTEPETEFTDPIAFFTGFAAAHFGRYVESTATNWCRQWWSHPEAHKVMNELWRSYEAHRPPDDPTDPSSEHAQWLVHIAYPLMNQLLAPEGPFKGCNARDEVGQGHKTPMKAAPLAHTIDPSGRYMP